MARPEGNLAFIEDSPLFDAAWYLETYPDVGLTTLSPAEHYLRIGGFLGRDPGPDFCTRDYNDMYPDVQKVRMNPLFHFEKYGRSEGRLPRRPESFAQEASPGSRLVNPPVHFASTGEARAAVHDILMARLEGNPKKLFPDFDTALEDRLLSAVSVLYRADRDRYEATKVSVIMPTFNRGDRIGNAIQSVLDQSHGNLELLVIDDGSTDNTRKVLEGFAHDSRVRALWNDHCGVSVARNTGLGNATGEIIFYLDSDNVWTPDFLATMVVGFDVSDTDCMYGASRLQNAGRQVLGYRGEPFSWDQCVLGNYIDMNVFAHRARMIEAHGVFDVTLQRMVDWDLILRYTKTGGAAYCPVLGCIYFEDGQDVGRITTSKPYIFRKIVHEKNKRGLTTTAEVFEGLSLNFCIKIPATYKLRHAWGDFHYAESLKEALERLGHKVRIDFLEDWDKHPVNSTDVTLVLRGLSSYVPKPSEFSILWNISHPDQISYEEYNLYKLIFVASVSYASLLSKVLGRKVHPLLQCTDSKRFPFRAHDNKPGAPGVFIGNSRNEYREIVRWAVESGTELEVYGDRWEKFIPAGLVKKINLPNDQLADVYTGGRFVLNDHWASMRDFGIISNRIFDVVGCGGRLISDRIPSIEHVFGGVVEMIDDAESLKAALARKLPPVSRAHRQAAAQTVHAEHSFDVRAREIMEHIVALLVRPDALAAGPAQTAHLAGGQRCRRVALFLQPGRAWPTSSAFIRLIAPLTTDYACTRIELICLDDPEDPRLAECDICIVQRVAVPEDAAAEALLDRLERLGVPLFVDTDDAFFLHEQHKDHDVALRRLMTGARATWFSTPELQKLYADVPGPKRVLPNSLDPRFWRNYRKPVNTRFDASKVRFLYMGTATHDDDFFDVLPAFERLGREMPDAFELTLIGAVRNIPDRPWIKVLPPPAEKGAYPDFVRWLVGKAAFDVGIAPLVDSAFNRAKSDIKFLDYCALGLLSMVSDCPAYEQVIGAGLAVGCGRDANDWYEKAAEILGNRAAFEQMRIAALDHVWQKRSVLKADPVLVDLLLADPLPA